MANPANRAILVQYVFTRDDYPVPASSVQLGGPHPMVEQQQSADETRYGHSRQPGRVQTPSLKSHRFLAYLSHDMRQLVHTVRLFNRTLAAILPADARSAQILERQEGALTTLGELLNSFSALCTLGDDAIVPATSDFSLQPILHRLRAEFEFEAAYRGLRLLIEDTDYVVRSDWRLLERILRNLLANSIRYTDTGEIRLLSSRGALGVRIEVRDTGIGIPADEQLSVFNDYHQANPSGPVPIAGHGLGLAIVRRFADSLGHPLEVRSNPGEGTCFALTIPEAAPAES